MHLLDFLVDFGIATFVDSYLDYCDMFKEEDQLSLEPLKQKREMFMYNMVVIM